MTVEGQPDAKNAAMISSVRTLTNTKLGSDHYRGSASELYRSSLLKIAAQRLQKILFY
ncbi:hypothetical protein GW17_00028622 [Ensete ventricosum]|nr:hypothetical protein GW17_00028622 [Ensete ventricosum]